MNDNCIYVIVKYLEDLIEEKDMTNIQKINFCNKVNSIFSKSEYINKVCKIVKTIIINRHNLKCLIKELEI